MILRRTHSLIIDDLKPEPQPDAEKAAKLNDDGDICTPKSDPPTEDDQPLE